MSKTKKNRSPKSQERAYVAKRQEIERGARKYCDPWSGKIKSRRHEYKDKGQRKLKKIANAYGDSWVALAWEVKAENGKSYYKRFFASKKDVRRLCNRQTRQTLKKTDEAFSKSSKHKRISQELWNWYIW